MSFASVKNRTTSRGMHAGHAAEARSVSHCALFPFLSYGPLPLSSIPTDQLRQTTTLLNNNQFSGPVPPAFADTKVHIANNTWDCPLPGFHWPDKDSTTCQGHMQMECVHCQVLLPGISSAADAAVLLSTSCCCPTCCSAADCLYGSGCCAVVVATVKTDAGWPILYATGEGWWLTNGGGGEATIFGSYLL